MVIQDDWKERKTFFFQVRTEYQSTPDKPKSESLIVKYLSSVWQRQKYTPQVRRVKFLATRQMCPGMKLILQISAKWVGILSRSVCKGLGFFCFLSVETLVKNKCYNVSLVLLHWFPVHYNRTLPKCFNSCKSGLMVHRNAELRACLCKEVIHKRKKKTKKQPHNQTKTTKTNETQKKQTIKNTA